MKAKSLVCLVVATTGTAVAAEMTALPDIDVDAQCAEQARSTGRGNAQRLYCLQTEQDGYNKLKARWRETPEPVRKVCANKWQHYSMINYCVDEELRATEAVVKFRFKK